MRLSKEKASEVLKVWKDKMGENPNADVFVILRRIARGITTNEQEVHDIENQVASLRTEESKKSLENRKVIAFGIIRRGDFSVRDLAAGAEVEARRDARMHDLTAEG